MSQQRCMENWMSRKPMNPDLGVVEIQRLEGKEPILESNGRQVGDVLAFWQWSASNLVNNIERGVFAEYLVALALGQSSGVRSSWDPYDLRTEEGITVEVKSCASIQAWPQRGFSKISFGIGPRISPTNHYSPMGWGCCP